MYLCSSSAAANAFWLGSESADEYELSFSDHAHAVFYRTRLFTLLFEINARQSSDEKNTPREAFMCTRHVIRPPSRNSRSIVNVDFFPQLSTHPYARSHALKTEWKKSTIAIMCVCIYIRTLYSENIRVLKIIFPYTYNAHFIYMYRASTPKNPLLHALSKTVRQLDFSATVDAAAAASL